MKAVSVCIHGNEANNILASGTWNADIVKEVDEWRMEERHTDGRTDMQNEREREIDSPTFGRSFVLVALEHQSRIIPLLHPPVSHPLPSTCDHSLHTSNPQPTSTGFDFLKPPSTTNSKPSPPPDWTWPPTLSPQTSYRPPKNSLPPFTNPSAR